MDEIKTMLQDEFTKLNERLDKQDIKLEEHNSKFDNGNKLLESVAITVQQNSEKTEEVLTKVNANNLSYHDNFAKKTEIDSLEVRITALEKVA